MTSAPRPPNSLWGVFRWPLLIALVTAGGLIAALIGDGPYDALSWLLLGGLVVLMAFLWRRRA
jgi:hypothetical protein